MAQNRNHKKITLIFFLLLLPFLSNCFTTLQTAKTNDGFSLTAGVQRYQVEKCSWQGCYYEGNYLLILAPRLGKKATTKRCGFEGGLRVITDVIDRDGRPTSALLFPEFKLQMPRDEPLDWAFAVDFSPFYAGRKFLKFPPLPCSFATLFSKDLSRVFTVYGEIKIPGVFYSFTDEENEGGFLPKITLGSEINLKENFSLLVEVERWFILEQEPRENLRFSLGICFHFPPEK